MQLPYFYEPHISAGTSHFILSEETGKHCIQVLRMKTGEQLQITDGKGNLFTSTIIVADKKNCEIKTEVLKFTEENKKNICIAVSLLKNNNRFEWFLEKATEIGVRKIIPLLCARTERQHFRFDRMNNILIAAMLQSRQVWLPVFSEPVIFNEAIPSSVYQQKLIAHCEEGEKKLIRDFPVLNNVQIFIGPEGDFSSEEIKLALQKGFSPVSLGSTRLRSETAGIVSATLLMNL